jgi:hypothetical protein
MYETNQILYGVKSELTHGQMFEDALSRNNLTIDKFEEMLNKDLKYNFELVHYQNKFNISYESRFGEKYAKIFLLFVRDSDHKLVISNSSLSIFNNNVFNYDQVVEILNDSSMNMEGFIYSKDSNNNYLCKVLHANYNKVMKYNPGYKTKQEQYIYLYKNNMLNDYVSTTNNKIFKDSVELVGIVAHVFTYVGQRMLDIYYKFSNNNMVHRNEDKYMELFNSKKYYTIFHTLGMMKGIHKYKQLNINEMRTLLKYKIDTQDIWKLLHELVMFEETENLILGWSNPLVKMFV